MSLCGSVLGEAGIGIVGVVDGAVFIGCVISVSHS